MNRNEWKGLWPLKRRGTGMADLVCLDNFTGDNRKAELAPKNLSHRVGDRVETSQFVRHHRQKKSGAISNQRLDVSHSAG